MFILKKKNTTLFFCIIWIFLCLSIFSCEHNSDDSIFLDNTSMINDNNSQKDMKAINSITLISFPELLSFDLYDNLETPKELMVEFQVDAIRDDVITAQWYISRGGIDISEEYGDPINIDIQQGKKIYSLSLALPQINYLKIDFFCELMANDGEIVYLKIQSEKCNVIQRMIDTGLPVIYIDTENYQPIKSKEQWCENTSLQIVNPDGSSYEYDMKIKGRGNATWNYPKKPYKIKLSEKAALLGMPKNKDWVLLANYCDKTLMRTSIGFKTSELLGMPWTPKSRYVELVINGEYLGSYQLVESIKEGNNRVNISDDGFLIERDSYYLQEIDYFVTNFKEYGFSFKYPESEDDSEFSSKKEYIEGYLNSLESVLFNEDNLIAFDEETGYQQYIDMNSLCQFFLVHNILQNQDMNQYFYKNDSTDSSKLCLGPAWDFEWCLGIGWYDGERPNTNHMWVNPSYYSRIIEDTSFQSAVGTLWNSNCVNIESDLMAFIDSLAEELKISQYYNFIRWDIMNEVVSVGGVPMGSFQNEVDCDKQFLHNHIVWLDDQITNW